MIVNSGRISIKGWIHKRHHIARPNELWGAYCKYFENIDRVITTPHCIKVLWVIADSDQAPHPNGAVVTRYNTDTCPASCQRDRQCLLTTSWAVNAVKYRQCDPGKRKLMSFTRWESSNVITLDFAMDATDIEY